MLFAVKLWDTETAAEQASRWSSPNTRVITLQNGVDSVDRVGADPGRRQTIGGVTYIATTIAAPGVVKHTSAFRQNALRTR